MGSWLDIWTFRFLSLAVRLLEFEVNTLQFLKTGKLVLVMKIYATFKYLIKFYEQTYVQYKKQKLSPWVHLLLWEISLDCPPNRVSGWCQTTSQFLNHGSSLKTWILCVQRGWGVVDLGIVKIAYLVYYFERGECQIPRTFNSLPQYCRIFKTLKYMQLSTGWTQTLLNTVLENIHFLKFGNRSTQKIKTEN